MRMGPPPSGVLTYSRSPVPVAFRSECSLVAVGSERAPVCLSASPELGARWSAARSCPLILMPEDHAALLEIIGRHLDRDPISRQRLDAVLFHTAGRVGDDLVPVIELHAEAGVRQNFGHQPFKLDQFFFCHACLMLMAVPDAASTMTQS